MIRRTRNGWAWLCLLLPLLVARGQAADRSWIDTSAGLNNWNDAANWNPSDDFAKVGDNAFFDQDAVYTAIVQSPSAADNVTFSNGDVTLGGGTLNIGGVTTIDDAFAAGLGDGAMVTASGLTWDTVGNAVVGDTGFGTITVDGGGDVRAFDVIVGDDVGAVGEINVTGVGSTLTTDGPNAGDGYLIGNAGTGTLNVTGGGLAQILNDTSGGIADVQLGVTADGDGTLNIIGATSSVIAEDVLVGNFGTGHLLISDGGVLNQNISTSPDAFIAQQLGSSGDATVHGDGSQWLMARLEVANLGDATLSIEAGTCPQQQQRHVHRRRRRQRTRRGFWCRDGQFNARCDQRSVRR
ncbi:MAG: hypothetical protein R3C10_26670 [Pirellulales bacterium]